MASAERRRFIAVATALACAICATACGSKADRPLQGYVEGEYVRVAAPFAGTLQQLTRHGLLASHMGIHGGYHLARPTGAISVAEIVEAIDGPLAITACGPADERCGQFSKCNVRDPLWRVKDRIVAVLRTLSLSEMARGDESAGPLKVRLGESGKMDSVEGR